MKREFSVSTIKEGGVLRALPTGWIDTVTCAEFDRTIRDSMEDMEQVVIDFGEVEYISSSATALWRSSRPPGLPTISTLNDKRRKTAPDKVFDPMQFFAVISQRIAVISFPSSSRVSGVSSYMSGYRASVRRTPSDIRCEDRL